MYFTEEDYTIFTAANSSNGSDEIKHKRKYLQNKMLRLHKQIAGEVEKLKLYSHKNEKHITSSITGDRHTGMIHSWIIVRYGKAESEMPPFNNSEYPFIHHACIQYGLLESMDAFAVELFLGNKGDYDLVKLIETLQKTYKSRTLKSAVEAELIKLKGSHFFWEADGDIFDLDTEEPEDFCPWLLQHKNADYVTLTYCYEDHADSRLSENNIASEVLDKIKLLRGLYNVIVQRAANYL